MTTIMVPLPQVISVGYRFIELHMKPLRRLQSIQEVV